jgi:hypothetical protein
VRVAVNASCCDRIRCIWPVLYGASKLSRSVESFTIFRNMISVRSVKIFVLGFGISLSFVFGTVPGNLDVTDLIERCVSGSPFTAWLLCSWQSCL